MFFGTGTAPHKNGAHAQDNQQRKKLLPVHAGNIAANPKRANGIFAVLILIVILILIAGFGLPQRIKIKITIRIKNWKSGRIRLRLAHG